MGLFSLINRLTTLPPAAPPAELQAEDKEAPPAKVEGPREAIFIDYRTLTFSAAVGLVQMAWLGLQAVEPSWFASRWWPLGMCLAIGMLVTVANLVDQKVVKRIDWVGGLLVGLLNSIVMCAAVLGINGTINPRKDQGTPAAAVSPQNQTKPSSANGS
jgi:hypothetical protein